MKNSTNQPIDTLPLNDRDKAKLLWAIEQANSQDEKQEQRRLRVSCTNSEAILTLKADGGGETKLAMLARNLSRWGAGLIHGRYIHPNSRCEVSMPALTGVWHNMMGTIRHARHIQGTIHELGIAFEEPVDLSDFVSLSPSEETRYLRELADDMPQEETAEVVQLSSRVLVVDDFSSDRKLYSHWLTQSGLTVTTASDARNALVQVQEQIFDLVVADYRLGSSNGADLIRELRESQFTAPIIAMSADESDTLKAELKEAGANKFMKKPFTSEELAQAAYQLIGVDAAADLTPILSIHRNDMEMRPLLTEFTRGLAGYIDELRDANARNNYDAIEHISHALKGTGDGYGFPAISERAGDILGCLNDEAAEVEKIKKATSDLIATLNRVKLS